MRALFQSIVGNESLRRMLPQQNRKFSFAICTLIAGTWLCANDKMGAESWSYFALGLAALYIGGNVGQKWAEKKYGAQQSSTPS